MKRIVYADAVVATDDEIAELVLRYAAQLAKLGEADTVRVPGTPAGERLQEVVLLLGPASQITVYEHDGEFEGDAGPAVEDLRRRIAALTTEIPASDDRVLGVPDDFDDLE